MKYIVYKITNTINNKIYIGKHQTENIDDDYFGSGKCLKYAINKYGRENFHKEILHVFDNEEDMNIKEAELVSEEFCNSDSTYNICPGGKGGWGYINNEYWTEEKRKKHSKHPNVIKSGKISGAIHKQRLKQNDEYKKHYVSLMKQRFMNTKNNRFFGKTHSEKTKQKIGQASSKHQQGSKNSQYGTMWITNGNESRKIKKIDTIPEGWYKGRVSQGRGVKV